MDALKRCMNPANRIRITALAGALTAVAAVATVCACTASSSGESQSPCDPLASPPTKLSNILGIGKDAQGTLYVADSPAGLPSPRVFVSGGGNLVRQDVRGSGQAGGGAGQAAQYTLTFAPRGADAASEEALLLDTQGGMATQMALGPANSKSFLGGPGETPLTVVDASAVSGLPIVNLPGVVEYVADVSDGTAIVITLPMDAASSADFHLFYGTPSAMQERKIVSFDQALSGYPTVAFQVGSQTYTMAIGGTFDPDGGGGPGPGTLDTGSAMLTFTLRMPTPSTLSAFSFTCF
jgi:hypothetical protein